MSISKLWGALLKRRWIHFHFWVMERMVLLCHMLSIWCAALTKPQSNDKKQNIFSCIINWLSQVFLQWHKYMCDSFLYFNIRNMKKINKAIPKEDYLILGSHTLETRTKEPTWGHWVVTLAGGGGNSTIFLLLAVVFKYFWTTNASKTQIWKLI